MRLDTVFSPRRAALLLGGIAIYLALQSLVMEYLIENVLDAVTHATAIQVIDLFSVNAESTIPTWYSVLLLFASAVLLVLIATAHRARREPYAGYWMGLAGIFLYLSMDEGAAIHEILSDALTPHLSATRYIAFPWIVVGLPLVIVFGLLYLRFWWRLPARTRWLFFLAGAIYVGGAIGVEAISANEWFAAGGPTFPYLAIATIEELCEMLGVVVFLYALLSYMAEKQFAFAFIPSGSPQRETQTTAETSHRLTDIPLARVFGGMVAVLIVIANTVLLAWAFGQPPRTNMIREEHHTPIQIILDQFPDEHVVVTRLDGLFGGDDPRGLDVSAALLTLYDEVMVLTLPALETSVVFAADDLPFDGAAVTDILRANGVTQFVIFETAAVRALVASVGTNE